MSSKFYLIIILVVLLGCSAEPKSAERNPSDTTTALSLLMNKEFLDRNMPGYGSINRSTAFGDTVFFVSDSIVKEFLPEQVNGFNFRFLTREQICELAISNHNDTIFPGFFELKRFQKVRDSFDIALRVTCVTPLFDKAGNKIFPADTSGSRCMFGLLCGGGMSVSVYKEKGIFKIKAVGSWSD